MGQRQAHASANDDNDDNRYWRKPRPDSLGQRPRRHCASSALSTQRASDRLRAAIASSSSSTTTIRGASMWRDFVAAACTSNDAITYPAIAAVAARARECEQHTRGS